MITEYSNSSVTNEPDEDNSENDGETNYSDSENCGNDCHQNSCYGEICFYGCCDGDECGSEEFCHSETKANFTWMIIMIVVPFFILVKLICIVAYICKPVKRKVGPTGDTSRVRGSETEDQMVVRRGVLFNGNTKLPQIPIQVVQLAPETVNLQEGVSESYFNDFSPMKIETS